MEDEYEKSDYEKTCLMMENSLISLNSLQGETFTVENEIKRSKEIGSFL